MRSMATGQFYTTAGPEAVWRRIAGSFQGGPGFLVNHHNFHVVTRRFETDSTSPYPGALLTYQGNNFGDPYNARLDEWGSIRKSTCLQFVWLGATRPSLS